MKKILRLLWQIIFVLFYPVITAFSLVFTSIIWVLSSLSRWLNSFSTSHEGELQKEPSEWKPFLNLGHVKLRKLKVDEVMFGPAYFKLNSTPRLPELDKHFWGQFNFPCFGGILLQKWQSVKEHELNAFDLMYFDPVRRQVRKLHTLPTYDWKARQLNAEKVIIEWFNGKEQLIISAADLN